MTYHEIISTYTCKPIYGCPGRHIIKGIDPTLPISRLAGNECQVKQYNIDSSEDDILIAVLDYGALISYHHTDGTCVHTINTPEGFRKKLQRLGIEFEYYTDS